MHLLACCGFRSHLVITRQSFDPKAKLSIRDYECENETLELNVKLKKDEIDARSRDGCGLVPRENTATYGILSKSLWILIFWFLKNRALEIHKIISLIPKIKDRNELLDCPPKNLLSLNVG